jgi:hypothetical protein
VAAAILLVVILASGGGGGSDGDGGNSNDGSSSSGPGETVDVEIPGGDGGGLDPELANDPAVTGGQALAGEFLDLVEAGDSEAAIAMLCDVGDNTQTWVDNINAAAGNVELEVDMSTAEVVSQGIVLSVDLTGTFNGEPTSGAHIGTAARDGCIVTFSAD